MPDWCTNQYTYTCLRAGSGPGRNVHRDVHLVFRHGGGRYGGCGVAKADLDSPNFVALNMQYSPGDYTTFHNRPIAREYSVQIGIFNNSRICIFS